MPLLARKPRALPRHRSVTMYRSQSRMRRHDHTDGAMLLWWLYVVLIIVLAVFALWAINRVAL